MASGTALKCRGCFDYVDIRDGSLEIAGGTIADNGATLSRVDVTLNGEPCPPLAASLNAASPQVAQAFPDTPRADRARFTLRVKVPSGYSRHDGLLALSRMFEAGPGWRLFHVLDSSIPLPPDEAARAIGGAFLGVGLEFLHFGWRVSEARTGSRAKQSASSCKVKVTARVPSAGAATPRASIHSGVEAPPTPAPISRSPSGAGHWFPNLNILIPLSGGGREVISAREVPA